MRRNTNTYLRQDNHLRQYPRLFNCQVYSGRLGRNSRRPLDSSRILFGDNFEIALHSGGHLFLLAILLLLLLACQDVSHVFLMFLWTNMVQPISLTESMSSLDPLTTLVVACRYASITVSEFAKDIRDCKPISSDFRGPAARSHSRLRITCKYWS